MFCSPSTNVIMRSSKKVNNSFAYVYKQTLKVMYLFVDFDLYLKRPGSRGEICLNPERDITEYGIKKDVIKLIMKAHNITTDISIYSKDSNAAIIKGKALLKCGLHLHVFWAKKTHCLHSP